MACSHPQAAALRSSANTAMNNFITQNHLEPYCVDMSGLDQRTGLSGSREYHHAKDLDLEERSDPILPKHCLKFVDSDYHYDFNVMTDIVPIIAYTFFPEKSGFASGDYAYSIENNIIDYKVTGGGSYKHSCWNWFVDNFVVLHNPWNETCLGPVFTFLATLCYYTRIPMFTQYWYVYKSEIRRVSENRYVVFAIPCAKMPDSFKRFMDRDSNIVTPKPLQRCKFGDQKINDYHYMLKGICYRTVSPAKSLWSVTLPYDTMEAIIVRQTESKTKPISNLEFSMKPYEKELGFDASVAAPLLHKVFHLLGLPFSTFMLPDVNYYFEGSLKTEVPIPTGTCLLPPLVENGVFTPCQSLGNDEKCIKERLTDLQALDPGDSHVYDGYVKEFNNLILGGRKFIPVSIDEVNDSMDKPGQRRDFKSVCTLPVDSKERIKSFQKRETYGDPKAPRNISTVSIQQKVNFSRFTQGLKSCFSRLPWYAFSKKPKAIGKRVQQVCSHAKVIVASDFSKFDGRHGALASRYEGEFYEEAFGKEALEIYKRAVKVNGKTKFGHKYRTGYSRPSGVPETSQMNSYINALVAFITLRVSGVSPIAGHNARTAWAKLGIYGGDDGITGDLDVACYKAVAERFGLKLTISETPASEPVMFLARCYPQPNLSTRNFGHVSRHTSKFFVSVAPPEKVTPIEAVVRKAQGYLVTDPNTPVLGSLSRKIMELYPTVETKHDTWNQSYWATKGPFNNDLIESDVLVICKDLGISLERLEQIEEQIKQATKLDDLTFDPIPRTMAALPGAVVYDHIM
jgi:hypothetical protein